MRTSGLDPLTRKPIGNHGVHLEPGGEIHYLATDRKRQEIPYVVYRKPGGKVIEYAAGGPPEKWRHSAPLRRMDCMDCHNRPTHTFQMPGPALDEALAAGLLDRSLPYLKKQSLEVLKVAYGSQAEGIAQIPTRLREFYGAQHLQTFTNQRAAVDAAAHTVVTLYSRNVFPEMKLSWGAYPNNLGHEPFPGCFRCHDGAHTGANGRAISGDCNACHQLLAAEEREPEILKRLEGQ